MNIATVEINKLWLSQKEARSYLGVSNDWLEERRNTGALHYSKVGKTIFYIKTEIDSLIRKHAITGKNVFMTIR